MLSLTCGWCCESREFQEPKDADEAGYFLFRAFAEDEADEEMWQCFCSMECLLSSL